MLHNHIIIIIKHNRRSQHSYTAPRLPVAKKEAGTLQDGSVLHGQISAISAENWQSLRHDTQYVLDQSQIQFAHGNLHYCFTLRGTSFFSLKHVIFVRV